MRRIISLIVMAVIVSSVTLAGFISYFTYFNDATTAANVVKYYHYDHLGEKDDVDVKVEIYARVYHDTEHAPEFAISELVNKSIDYRKKHPEATNMTIDSAFYRIEKNVACYYKRGSRNYGKLTRLRDRDYTADGECERILYSFVKAAMNGIKVRLMWHIPEFYQEKGDTEEDNALDYFTKFYDQPCTFDSSRKIGEFLECKHCTWPNAGISQMHNKQVLVSNYLDYDGKEYEGAVYSATSNIDYYRTSNLPVSWKDWSHTGFIVSNHPYVYQSNVKYFDVCYRNAYNRFEFANEMFELHNKGMLLDGGINYIDENFECYFTPLTQEGSADMYDVVNNPLARYIEKMNDCSGKIECFLNQYAISDDVLINKCVNRIYDAFKNNHTKGNQFGYVANGTFLDPETKKTNYDHQIYSKLREIGTVTLNKMTHAKDSIFYISDSDEYAVLTGSTNFCLSNFVGQSNTLMLFKENSKDHRIYDCFKENYFRTAAAEK